MPDEQLINVISYKGEPHVAILNPERAKEEIERLVAYGCERDDITLVEIPYF